MSPQLLAAFLVKRDRLIVNRNDEDAAAANRGAGSTGARQVAAPQLGTVVRT